MKTAETGFSPVSADDVVSALKNCSDVFSQLAALLKVIKGKSQPYSDAAELAELGAGVAFDMDNFADSMREQARKGGIKS